MKRCMNLALSGFGAKFGLFARIVLVLGLMNGVQTPLVAAASWSELGSTPLTLQQAVASLDCESPVERIDIAGAQQLNKSVVNTNALHFAEGAIWTIAPPDDAHFIVIRVKDLYLPSRSDDSAKIARIVRGPEAQYKHLDGVDGADGANGASDRPAHTGKDGSDGIAGIKGGQGATIKLPDLYLIVDAVHVEPPATSDGLRLAIAWDGVRGGKGGHGGNGGNGGDGAQGVDAKCGWFSCEAPAGRGGNGGAAGAAGPGGDAGAGGNGGNVFIVAPPSQFSMLSGIELSQEGGASGGWGLPGLPGRVGAPGEPGGQCSRCLKFSPLNLAGTIGRDLVGAAALHGQSASPGERGIHGFIAVGNAPSGAGINQH